MKMSRARAMGGYRAVAEDGRVTVERTPVRMTERKSGAAKSKSAAHRRDKAERKAA